MTFLEKNSRINLGELAILLGMDEVSVANEIADMEKEHVICGYHTLIDWDKTSEEKLTALMADPGIVRNRKKLEAARTNAKVFLMIQEEQGSFDRYLWGFTGGVPVVDDSIPPLPLSKEVSRDLKRRGMRFVGETTVHAFLQAAGVINAHEAGCFRRGERK